MNILGNGVALDLENLWNEIQTVEAQGVKVGPDKLRISDRSIICI